MAKPAKKVKLVLAGRRLEGTVSSEMRAEMDLLGITSYKTSDRYHSGIPDIYIPSGQWIESKVIPRLPTKINPPIRYFSGAQRKEIRKLLAAGDEVYSAIFFQFDMANRAFVMAPWWEFERIAGWDLDTIQMLGHIVPYGEKPDYRMRTWFQKGNQRVDTSLWDEKFAAWVNKYPEKFDEKKRYGKWPAVRYDPDDEQEEGDGPDGMELADEEADTD